MKSVLIASYDMEIGGVERSLASMLNNFDYKKHDVDLLLYNHTGPFLQYIPAEVNLLPQNKSYSTIRKGIGSIARSGMLHLAFERVRAKFVGKSGIKKGFDDTYQMQLMWRYCKKYFRKVDKKYDVAISYLWPHDFVLDKVNAKVKIAWIHTDYSKINPDREMDLKIWERYDYIVAVSEDCLESFLKIYPTLVSRCRVIENITSPKFIKEMSDEGRDKIPFDSENFNLLSVARFSYAKGIDIAVETLRILKKRGYENIKWYVVGYGGDEEQIKRLIEAYSLKNNFILLGKRENPYPFMKRCDLYVQPSRYEGKAVTVSEAQILGKPVLITNYPTASSQVKDGVDGIITDLSPEGLADKIEILYKDRDILKRLENHCSKTDFSNEKELERLYELF
ncbi:MAG: glycosyltransferase [Cetobacterium sp.]|uniref:glycosyltransferase n=1 Tax=Cetobacterium sp. TaxID=2071632 RepID=UPI003F2B434D